MSEGREAKLDEILPILERKLRGELFCLSRSRRLRGIALQEWDPWPASASSGR
jgi:hypothetical protein